MFKTICLLLPLALLLSACAATPPSRFYILTPQAQQSGEAKLENLLVGVGPVRLAAYLERPQIVARESGNRLRVEEFDRWGGALETNVAWVVAENLSVLLGSEGVVTYPWERAVIPSYQIAIDIRRFDQSDDRTVNLSAQWRILGPDGRELRAIGRSEIVEAVDGSGFGTLVAAQSRALAAFSGEIAERLRQLTKER